jgi:type IV secretory pathway TrbF-like protein
MFNKKNLAGGSKTEPILGMKIPKNTENPYLSARREWNERYGSYISQKRTWQLTAIAAMALSGLLGVSLVTVASQSKVQPFIVQVDKLGQAVAVSPAEKAQVPDERIVRFQLAEFIKNARSVTPDALVMKRWLDDAYSIVAPNASQYLNDYYRKEDPFQTARQSMVVVEIVSAQPLSQNTWQVNWTETRRGLNGSIEGMTRWQAIVTVKNFVPTTPQQIVANPTGVVIDQLNWTQQL